MWQGLAPRSTSVTLVRHGQASYLEEIYDRLSPTGELQSRLLGEHWLRGGTVFDAVFCGPAERHRRTAEIAGRVLIGGGIAWPEPEVLPEFDEFQGEEIMRFLTPVLAERHPQIRRMAEEFRAAGEAGQRRETLDRLFHEVARRWAAGEVEAAGVESWPQFAGRVERGLERVREGAGQIRHAAVFTSAGPIAVVASLALRIPPRETLELAFCPRNASLSEFALRDGEIRLGCFNCHPHLDDPALLTHR
jgi:broad specificity phosphatase PhoE